MNTKLSNKEIQSAFDDVFHFSNEKDELEKDAKLIMAKFLSKIDEVAKKKGITKRKDLADMVGTSASYLTQLYRGHKLMNLTTAAKFQKALGISFNIELEGEFGGIQRKEEIARYLDKFYQEQQSGDYIKVIRVKNKQDIQPEDDTDFTYTPSKKGLKLIA